MSQITKISTDYTLSDGENTIKATVFENKITITPGNNNHDKFEFKNSDPSKVNAIVQLIQDATLLEAKQ